MAPHAACSIVDNGVSSYGALLNAIALAGVKGWEVKRLASSNIRFPAPTSP